MYSEQQPQSDITAQIGDSGAATQQPGEWDEARRLQREAVDELAQFKARVREVALAYGVRHNMCEALDEALVELGLEPRLREYTVQLRITGHVRVQVEATSEDTALAAARDHAGIDLETYYSLNCEDFFVLAVEGTIDC
jgi:hypothetical protein